MEAGLVLVAVAVEVVAVVGPRWVLPSGSSTNSTTDCDTKQLVLSRRCRNIRDGVMSDEGCVGVGEAWGMRVCEGSMGCVGR